MSYLLSYSTYVNLNVNSKFAYLVCDECLHTKNNNNQIKIKAVQPLWLVAALLFFSTHFIRERSHICSLNMWHTAFTACFLLLTDTEWVHYIVPCLMSFTLKFTHPVFSLQCSKLPWIHKINKWILVILLEKKEVVLMKWIICVYFLVYRMWWWWRWIAKTAVLNHVCVSWEFGYILSKLNIEMSASHSGLIMLVFLQRWVALQCWFVQCVLEKSSTLQRISQNTYLGRPKDIVG